MSRLQSTIPFKSRKLRCSNNKRKTKCDIENVENTNIISPVRKEKNLKRHNITSEEECEYETCSPTKIYRHIETDDQEISKNIVSETNRVGESMKALTSREKEIEFLQNFIEDHLNNEKSGSLYISGQPGTGKTACLTYILQLPAFKKGFKQVYVNCTMVKSARSIYTRICNELHLKTSSSSEKACLTAIENYLFKKRKNMILLVLDEIDQLDSKRQSVLYSIFEWPALANSKLVLIGVANALDLTERSLPRLQSRCSLKPQTLHFAPYTKQQIIDIFTAKIANEDKGNIFPPAALQMMAAKTAAISGDMRRALDVAERVVELARRNRFQENQSVDLLLRDSSVTVELKQVLEVLNEVYGGSANLKNDADECLPIQQKLILCSLMLILTKGKNKDLSMGKLYDVYKRVVRTRTMAALDMSEFVTACALLESRGALRVCGSGATRSRRLTLQWDEVALSAALSDRSLLAAILQDVHCLAS